MFDPIGIADHVICSRSGCTRDARWLIRWHNPRIHTTPLAKTWTACDDHRDYLSGFLTSRSFPVEVEAMDGGARS